MFRLVQTCGGCPEAYDVYLDNHNEEWVGNLRLRHGFFSAEYKGETVYSAEPPYSDGVFDWDEREFYLQRACEAIRDAIAREEGREQERLYYVEQKYVE